MGAEQFVVRVLPGKFLDCRPSLAAVGADALPTRTGHPRRTPRLLRLLGRSGKVRIQPVGSTRDPPNCQTSSSLGDEHDPNIFADARFLKVGMPARVRTLAEALAAEPI